MGAFIEGIITSLRSNLDPRLLGSQFAGMAANIVIGIAVFIAFFVIWRVVQPILRYGLKRGQVDRTNTTFVESVVRVVIMSMGTVHALAAVGVNMGALLTSLGVAGLTIGFAARDALSNIISGILIFWDRPFVIGDLVEVGDSYGKVENITLRSTRVVTVDGRMLAVPNSVIINTTVASYTNFPNLRLAVPVTVGVQEDLGRVRRALLVIVEKDDAFKSDPSPAVVVTALNDYNVEVELRAWIHDERNHIALRLKLRESMYEALRSAGVDMPFETLKLEPVEVSGALQTAR